MDVRELYAYLCVADAAAAIRFYTEAFGARETFRLAEPSGRIGHAELELAGTTLMLADEFPEFGIRSATTLGGTPVTLHLHVDDCDATIDRAVKLGAQLEREPQDHFYGERSGSVFDPQGHRWLIGHTIEQISPQEMQRRYTQLFETT